MKTAIKALYKKLKTEIGKRETHFLSKPEKWRESVTGDKYLSETEVYKEFFESVETVIIDLGITIKPTNHERNI